MQDDHLDSPESRLAQACHFIDQASGGISPPIQMSTTYARDADYDYIGDYSYVSQYTMINKTMVEKFVSIANGCHIGLWEHNTAVSTHTFYLYETSGFFVKGYTNLDMDHIETRIGNDVWIGANSVILKGVTVHDGAIVGAGSVVTRDVPPYSIVAGNPAREIRKRYSEEDIRFLEDIRWWDFSRETLQNMVDQKLFTSFEKFKEYVQGIKG